MPDDLTEKIIEFAEKRTFDVNDFVVRAGDPSDSVYLIAAGMIKISAGSFEDYSGPGIVIGEMGVLTGTCRTANVEALTEIQAFSISAENLHRLMKESSMLKKALWTTAGIRAAFNILSRVSPYYSWPTNKVKLFCEEGYIIERKNHKPFQVDDSEYLLLCGSVTLQSSKTVLSPICRIPIHERTLRAEKGTIMLVIPQGGEDAEIDIDAGFGSDDEESEELDHLIEQQGSVASVICAPRVSITGMRKRSSVVPTSLTSKIESHGSIKFHESDSEDDPQSTSKLINSASLSATDNNEEQGNELALDIKAGIGRVSTFKND